MNAEIKELREELARLRERVAVLESAQQYPAEPFIPVSVPTALHWLSWNQPLPTIC